MTDEMRPIWDEDFAQSLLNKILLIGLTYVDPQGDRLEQMYGEIVDVDREKGINVRLEGDRSGESFWLPPDLRSIFVAEPGSYRLTSTGKIVEDPDYTATWTITPPQH